MDTHLVVSILLLVRLFVNFEIPCIGLGVHRLRNRGRVVHLRRGGRYHAQPQLREGCGLV